MQWSPVSQAPQCSQISAPQWEIIPPYENPAPLGATLYPLSPQDAMGKFLCEQPKLQNSLWTDSFSALRSLPSPTGVSPKPRPLCS